jgi:hypothetical protein
MPAYPFVDLREAEFECALLGCEPVENQGGVLPVPRTQLLDHEVDPFAVFLLGE